MPDVAIQLGGKLFKAAEISPGLYALATALQGFDGTDYDPLRIDAITQTLRIIGSVHHEAHDKALFSVDVADESMADNDTLILTFKTPAGTKRAHFWPSFATLVAGEMELWEGPSWTTNTGTRVAPVNHFRETSPETSTLLEDKTATPAFTADGMVLNPTGLNVGSALSLRKLYAFGTVARPFSSGVRADNEIILMPDQTYALVFTANGGSNAGNLACVWYEHTDR